MELSLNEVGTFIRDVGTPAAILLGILAGFWKAGKFFAPHFADVFTDHREFLKSQSESNRQCLEHHRHHALLLQATNEAVGKIAETQDRLAQGQEKQLAILDLVSSSWVEQQLKAPKRPRKKAE